MDKYQFKGWKWILMVVGIIVFNLFASNFNFRWDLTSSGIYTLSDRNKEIIQTIDERVVATLLLGDNIPASFQKLKSESEFFLSNLHEINNRIWYDIFDPNQGSISQVNALRDLFSKKNVNPTNIRITTSEGVSENLIYPYVHLEKNGAELFINILEDRQPGETEEDAIYRSIQKLESKVAKGIYELSKPSLPRIGLVAFDKLLNKSSFDLSKYLDQKYQCFILSPSDLYNQRDSTTLAIIPVSPDITITKEDLIYIDQFLMNGGKLMWLIEEYAISVDSVDSNISYVPPYNELPISDFLFQSGVKLTGNWISDLRSSRIPQVIGQQGGRAQTELFNYPFHGVFQGNPDHWVSAGLGEINAYFPTALETTLTSFPLEKTILLSSSEYSKRIKYPYVFSFESLRQNPDIDSYNDQGLVLSLLLEGTFSSYFRNRMNSDQIRKLGEQGISMLSQSKVSSAQIVISDQEIFMPGANRLGRPYPIGFNKWERTVFQDNETFLDNCVEYLLNGDEFLRPDERSDYKLAALDKEKVVKESSFWVGFNLLLPVLILLLIHLAYSFYLRKKYA